MKKSRGSTKKRKGNTKKKRRSSRPRRSSGRKKKHSSTHSSLQLRLQLRQLQRSSRSCSLLKLLRSRPEQPGHAMVIEGNAVWIQSQLTLR